VNDWGIAALERATEGLKCETAVHICYGYGIKISRDDFCSCGNASSY
jgi:5-methyltetrahydropteroyltriglutamate--homocysteine methyltransferase